MLSDEELDFVLQVFAEKTDGDKMSAQDVVTCCIKKLGDGNKYNHSLVLTIMQGLEEKGYLKYGSIEKKFKITELARRFILLDKGFTQKTKDAQIKNEANMATIGALKISKQSLFRSNISIVISILAILTSVVLFIISQVKNNKLNDNKDNRKTDTNIRVNNNPFINANKSIVGIKKPDSIKQANAKVNNTFNK